MVLPRARLYESLQRCLADDLLRSHFDASGHGKVVKRSVCETKTVKSSTLRICKDIVTTCAVEQLAIKISQISGVA